MTPPKKIYLSQNQLTGVPDDWQKTRCESSDVAYFSEEHIRAIANELYNNGDAFIAKLNGKSFSEYLKGASDD